ncbi:MAG: hypothetical protein FJ095_13280, partial [Deltaproteobacteria bacterium]|nr:hypothetical protein [Deltaproteobacteria bacterium]
MPGPTHASLVDLFVGHLPLVVELVNFKKVTSLSVGGKHACAILDDQTIKCWGANGSGQLGLGDNTPRGTTQ